MQEEHIKELHEPWVTEYRGQFSYAVPKTQSFSFVEEAGSTNNTHTHPSARVPHRRDENGMVV